MRSDDVVRWRQRLKIKAIKYKGGCCIVCGYDRCVSALSFHHLDPKTKDFGISGKTMSWNRVQLELAKCVLLCHNCHAEVHSEVVSLSEHLHKDVIIPDQPILKKRMCVDCNFPLKNYSKRCLPCSRKKSLKIQWPPYEELRSSAIELGYEALGRKLGVSGNAIRKRLRTMEQAMGLEPMTICLEGRSSTS